MSQLRRIDSVVAVAASVAVVVSAVAAALLRHPRQVQEKKILARKPMLLQNTEKIVVVKITGVSPRSDAVYFVFLRRPRRSSTVPAAAATTATELASPVTDRTLFSSPARCWLLDWIRQERLVQTFGSGSAEGSGSQCWLHNGTAPIR